MASASFELGAQSKSWQSGKARPPQTSRAALPPALSGLSRFHLAGAIGREPIRRDVSRQHQKRADPYYGQDRRLAHVTSKFLA